jgi:hypothetical protein
MANFSFSNIDNFHPFKNFSDKMIKNVLITIPNAHVKRKIFMKKHRMSKDLKWKRNTSQNINSRAFLKNDDILRFFPKLALFFMPQFP